MGASFSRIGGITVGAEVKPGVKLADLKVTGYEEDDNVGRSCYGAIDIALIANDGANLYYEDGDLAGVEMKYVWIDDGMGGEGGFPAGWYDPGFQPLDGVTSPYGDANTIVFQAGEGLFFEVTPGYEACKLVSSGEVIQGQVQYIFGQELYNYVANPLPVPVALSKISLSGYEEDDNVGRSCYGAIDIALIANDGANLYYEDGDLAGIEMKYVWIDDGMGGEGGFPAGWYDPGFLPLDGVSSPYGDATKIMIAAGESAMFEVTPGYEQCFVKFPSLAEATAK